MALFTETEKWIIDKMRRYPYGYYEIAYVLHRIKVKMFAEEVLIQSRKKKMNLFLMVEKLSKKLESPYVN